MSTARTGGEPAPSPPAAAPPAWSAAASTRERALLAVLVVAALALRLAGARWGLPEVYEEAVPSRIAWGLWAWGDPKGFTGHPHTFGYPSLVFYVHFAGQLLLYAWLKLSGGITSALDFRVLYALDKTPFMLVARGINAGVGAALVWATWRLARPLAGPAAALFAAVFAAFAPALVLKATEAEVDLPVTLLVTLATAAALALLERPTLQRALGVGALAGLAASAKYPGAIALVPGVLALLVAPHAAFAPVAAPEPAVSKKRRNAAPAAAPHTGLAPRMALALALVVAAVAAFALTSPWLLLDRAGFVRDMANQKEHMALGHFGEAGGAAFGWNAHALATRLLGWPLALAALAGLVAAVRGPARRAGAVIAAMVLAYLVVVGSWTMKADRYLLPVLPAAFALAGAALALALARVPERTRALGWGIVALACAAPFALATTRGEVLERFRPDTRTEALRWIQRQVPEGAFIVTEEYGPTLANLTIPEYADEVAPRLAQIPRRPRFYAVQHLPMFQVDPARSAAFYQPALYRAADLVLTTGSVRARYLADRATFARQCAFYDTLEQRWIKLKEFSGPGRAGTNVALYRNPDHDGWFPQRRDVPMPAEAGPSDSGMENYFYWNLGVNYETGGHFEQAIACYRIALRYAPRADGMELYASVATRLTYCLLRTRGLAGTFAALDDAGRNAKLEMEARVLAWVIGKLREDPRSFEALGVPRLGN